MSCTSAFRQFQRRLAIAPLLVLGALSLPQQAGAATQASAPRQTDLRPVEWVQLHSPQRSEIDIRPTLTTAKAALRLVVPGFETGIVQHAAVAFTRIAMPGAGVTAAVGKPELPVIRRFVAVPDGAEVSFVVKTGTPQVLHDVQVYPVQEPIAEQQTQTPAPPPAFAYAKDFYALDQNYPSDLVTVSKPMKMRNLTLVQVEIAAMQYNPAQKTLLIYPDVDVELSFSVPFAVPPGTGAAEGNPAPTPDGLKISSNKLFVNWDWVLGLKAKLPWHYLIVTPDAFAQEVEPLAQWKRSKGLTVHVTRLSEIAATPTSTQIRDYIKQAYEDHAISYVLLVGDTDSLPGYMYTGQGGTISDYYYALVAGSDYLPDLAIGRFSGRTEAEVTHLVEKTVNYEQAPATGGWRSRALVISDDDYFQDTSDYNDENLTSHGFVTDKIYASLGNTTTANVAAAINDGRLLVSYRGHGFETGWNTTGFSNTDVNALTNGNMLPVIISPTCLTGMYDFGPSDSYSEAWTKAHSGSAPLGAVAYWGSARVSYGGYNDELSKGAFDDILDNHNHVIGDVVNDAKLHMISHYGVVDGLSLLELHMFNLFGDPELNIGFVQAIAKPNVPVAYDPFWWLKHPYSLIWITVFLTAIVIYSYRVRS